MTPWILPLLQAGAVCRVRHDLPGISGPLGPKNAQISRVCTPRASMVRQGGALAWSGGRAHAPARGTTIRRRAASFGRDRPWHRTVGAGPRGHDPPRIGCARGLMQMKMYHVYVLQSESDAGLYIGFSTDLRQRLVHHEAGDSQATRHRRPWLLVYYEAYRERQDAEGRERFLKSGAGRRHLAKQCTHWFKVHPQRGAA